MSFFDQLSSYLTNQYPYLQPQQLQQQQMQSIPGFPYRICMHGLDCVLCKRIEEETIEQVKMLKEKEEQKKLDYKKKCKDYINKFRGG